MERSDRGDSPGGAIPHLQVEPGGERDEPSRDSGGRPIGTLIEGVACERLTPHVDHRGSLVEAINFDHPFWQEPVVYAYRITVARGRIKGWGMHKIQADRYFHTDGDVRVVLYDGRVNSPTQGRFNQFWFADASTGLLRIPPGVWHADQNFGDTEAALMNFPTEPFRHQDPDKYRIDPHGGEIAFDWTLADS
ncbi:MAG: dTDP-4-dehydrorhamnose 3,5-epimerase family protein [Solirubrobacterales bacterium]